MKGEATPDRIAELEELFELNRDNSKIRQLKKYVEEYELTVKRRVQLEEQARLRIQELEKLKKRVDNIKNQ